MNVLKGSAAPTLSSQNVDIEELRDSHKSETCCCIRGFRWRVNSGDVFMGQCCTIWGLQQRGERLAARASSCVHWPLFTVS